MPAQHLPQPPVITASNNQRGPREFHQPSCSCGWAGVASSPENAAYQLREHIRTT